MVSGDGNRSGKDMTTRYPGSLPGTLIIYFE
jgi:hypothetical protein